MSIVDQLTNKKERQRKAARREEIRHFRHDGWQLFFCQGKRGFIAMGWYCGNLLLDLDTVEGWFDKYDAERLANLLAFAPRIDEPLRTNGYTQSAEWLRHYCETGLNYDLSVSSYYTDRNRRQEENDK